MAILFIYISKNDENFPKTQKFFHFLKIKFNKFVKFGHPKKTKKHCLGLVDRNKGNRNVFNFETPTYACIFPLEHFASERFSQRQNWETNAS